MELPVAVREGLSDRRNLSVILWLLGWLALAIVAPFAAAFSRFPADLWLARRLQDIDASGFISAVDVAEDLADLPWTIVVWLVAVAALVATAKRPEALLLLAIMVARLPNAGIKELVERPRPSPELVRVADDAAGFSFPSGHTTGAIVLYGFLFYLATVLIPRPAPRLLVQLTCIYIIVFNALERVYVGGHWPSDILGSLLFAGPIVALFAWAHRRLLSA